MSRVLSLKLREDIFNDVEDIIHKIKMSRNAYINEAISFYNRQNRRKLLEKQLATESRMVQQNSMEVLEEFEQLEDRIIE